MEVIRGSINLRPQHRSCVATLGNFDGVHLGHQHVLRQLVAVAKQRNLPATILTTEPLSREFFAPDTAPPRLTRLREKLSIFAAMGVDRVLCQRFNQALANISAEHFVENVLVKGLAVTHLILGDDSRFGKGRQGDFELLQRLGKQHHFTVEKSTSVLAADGGRISSSRIRTALTAGDMNLTKTLLGRAYHMSGRIAHGDKRGRQLGFPTANIHIKRRQTPVMGIFAVEIAGVADHALPGVASIGVRPTFGGGRCLLEVYIFDFDGDIYGRHVDVYFHHKLRDEQRFDSVEALVQQMYVDTQQAKDFFANRFAQ